MNELKLIMLFLTLLVVAAIHFMLRQAKVPGSKLHLWIYSSLWCVLLVWSALSNDEFAIQGSTYFAFCLAWISVYIGSAIVYLGTAATKTVVVSQPRYSPSRILVSMLVIILLSFLGNLLFFRALFAAGLNLEFLVLLRTEEGYDIMVAAGNFLYNVFGRIYVVYIPLAMWLFHQRKINALALGLIILFAMATALGTFTRVPILFVVLLVFCSVIVMRIKISKTAMVLMGITGVGLVIGSTLFILSFQELIGESVSFFYTAKMYLVGSLRTFDQMLSGHYYDPAYYDSAWYSADFVNYFLAKLHLINSYPSLVRNYAPAIDSNVYTYLDAFYLDFGVAGIFAGAMVCGMLTAWLDVSFARSQRIWTLVMYGYCCFAFAVSFMNNEFIRSYFFIILFIALLTDLFSRSAKST